MGFPVQKWRDYYQEAISFQTRKRESNEFPAFLGCSPCFQFLSLSISDSKVAIIPNGAWNHDVLTCTQSRLLFPALLLLLVPARSCNTAGGRSGIESRRVITY